MATRWTATMDRHETHAADHTGPMTCPTCDVSWRGAATSTCWTCGRPGVVRAGVTLVPDEA